MFGSHTPRSPRRAPLSSVLVVVTLASVLFALAPSTAVAQGDPASQMRRLGDVPDPRPADVDSIESIVAAVYDVISGDAGEQRDWDRFRSLFHPESRLIAIGMSPRRPEAASAFFMSVDGYIERTGPALMRADFYETEVNSFTERFANLAHVLSVYEARRDPGDAEPFQRGINSIQLMFDGERWWVMTIYWQGASDDHPIPERYLGGR